MASVQELLLAAKAKQKPAPESQLATLIDSASQGYSEGIDLRNKISEADLRRAQIAKDLVEQHLKQQQLDNEARNGAMVRDFIQKTLGIQDEQTLRDGLASTGKPPAPVTPSDKFDYEIGLDENGKGSLKIKSKTAAPKAPAGFRYTATGDLEAIPGGPADIKAQSDKAKADLALASQTEKAQNVLGAVQEAKGLVNNWSTGYGSILKNIPLTDANALSAKIKTIQSNLGIDQLNQMREASKTGASGFGQLSDKELEVITSAVANLNTAQRKEDIVANLDKIEKHYNNWLSLQKGTNPYGSGGGAPSPDGGTGGGAPNKIKVIRLSDGQPGTINESDYDPAKYKRN